MLDQVYEQSVDKMIKATIRTAVVEKRYYIATDEWSAEMASKYDTIIMLLVAVQATGEKLFSSK